MQPPEWVYKWDYFQTLQRGTLLFWHLDFGLARLQAKNPVVLFYNSDFWQAFCEIVMGIVLSHWNCGYLLYSTDRKLTCRPFKFSVLYQVVIKVHIFNVELKWGFVYFINEICLHIDWYCQILVRNLLTYDFNQTYSSLGRNLYISIMLSS